MRGDGDLLRADEDFFHADEGLHSDEDLLRAVVGCQYGSSSYRCGASCAGFDRDCGRKYSAWLPNELKPGMELLASRLWVSSRRKPGSDLRSLRVGLLVDSGLALLEELLRRLRRSNN